MPNSRLGAHSTFSPQAEMAWWPISTVDFRCAWWFDLWLRDAYDRAVDGAGLGVAMHWNGSLQ